MKKLLSICASLLALVLVLTACSSKTETKKENVTIKVASHTAPMTDMLEMIKDDLKKEGYNLELVKVSDNVQANVALNNKEVDANFFQHKPFMEQFNAKNKGNLVAVQPIYNATVAFYSKDIKDIKDLKNGADVAIPSDPTNMARALRLLDHGKVITLKDPNSYTVTVDDIKENPKNLKFSPISLLNLNEAYKEKDLVFNYPTYIAKLNLTPGKDGLLVEDEKDLNNIITKHLKKNNFSVDSVFNGEEALEYLEYGAYDLIILDIMLPKVNGYEVIKKLRENKNETAVLMLTARDSIEDKIKGLDLGADDYLIKPFDFGELLARIRALVRRKYGNTSNTMEIDDLCIDIAKKTVVRGGKNIELTGKEYEVLEYLIQNKGHVLSRDKIRDSVWDYGYEGESNIIDVLIKNIRKKIDIGDSKPIIHTKRGLGYVLKEDE